MYYENNMLARTVGIEAGNRAAQQYETAGACIGSIGQARDRGMLEVSMDGNANAISELAAEIKRLDERLQSVMRPELPHPVPANPNKTEIAAQHSPVVGYLQEQRRQINGLASRVAEIVNRLDL